MPVGVAKVYDFDESTSFVGEFLDALRIGVSGSTLDFGEFVRSSTKTLPGGQVVVSHR